MSENKPAKPAEDRTAEGRTAQTRRTRGRLFLIANAALLTAIVLAVNYLSFRHYERWDWTKDSLFTLSERSEKVLERLEQPIEVWVMVGAAEPEHAELRNLLERYRTASPQLSVHYVDPDRDPGGYERAVRRFRLRVGQGETREGVVTMTDIAVVVAAGDRHWEIGREDLIRHSVVEQEDEQRIQLNVEAEQALTGAILQVTEGEPTKVCLTRGHGELPVDTGLSELVAEMRRENLAHETIETRGASAIPESCDLLAIIGPNLAFDEDEARIVREYVRGGGNLLVALDPVPDRDQHRVASSGLEGTLRDFGVRLGRDVVVEPSTEMLPAGQGHPIALYLVARFGEHPITDPFRDAGFGVLVAEARTVTPIDDGAKVLMRASDRSYGETALESLAEGDIGDAGPDDVPGPVSIGVATQVEVMGREDDEKAAGGRVVVLGDATMLTSQLLATPSVVNLPFAAATLGWLTEREAMISIPPRTVDAPAMPTTQDVADLFFRVVVLIPLAFIFLGVAVWWNRRL